MSIILRVQIKYEQGISKVSFKQSRRLALIRKQVSDKIHKLKPVKITVVFSKELITKIMNVNLDRNNLIIVREPK